MKLTLTLAYRRRLAQLVQPMCDMTWASVDPFISIIIALRFLNEWTLNLHFLATFCFWNLSGKMFPDSVLDPVISQFFNSSMFPDKSQSANFISNETKLFFDVLSFGITTQQLPFRNLILSHEILNISHDLRPVKINNFRYFTCNSFSFVKEFSMSLSVAMSRGFTTTLRETTVGFFNFLFNIHEYSLVFTRLK